MMKVLTASVLAMTLASCGVSPATPTPGATAAIEQRSTEANQQDLMRATPLPRLTRSAERINLAHRLDRLNTENLNGCIYLLSYGHVMAFYSVKGKVSSLNAYLTGDQQIVEDPYGYGEGRQGQLIESPDLDGTYGKNADGIFFFTPDTDSYVEWRGDYLYSDQCLRLNQEPALVRNVH